MSQKLSIYLSSEIFEMFEEMRNKKEFNKSEAVQEAIKLWVREQVERDIAEACRREAEEESELAEAAHKLTGSHITEIV